MNRPITDKKLFVVGYKDDPGNVLGKIIFSKELQYLTYADNIFRGKDIDRAELHMELESVKDIDHIINALKTLKPCFDE